MTSLRLDLVFTRWWGDVTLDEFRETFRLYLTDAHYRPGRTELTDFSGVRKVDASFTSIWSVLNLVNRQVPGQVVHTRTVLIAPSEEIYGLSRIYQTLAENADGIRVELYRSEIDALAALGLGVASITELLEAGDFLPYTAGTTDRDGA